MITRDEWILAAGCFQAWKAAEGDRTDLWRQVDDLVRPRAYRYSLRLQEGHVHNAEDALQDTLMGVMEHSAHAPADGALFRRWFYSIARCVNLNLRRVPKWREGETSIEGVDVPERRPGTVTQIRRNETAAKVQAALNALPARDAAVARMHFLDEESVATISLRLKLQTRRIRRTLRRARNTLRERLTRDGLAVG